MSEIKINTAPQDPASPHISNVANDGSQLYFVYAEDGLTKRELFAAFALAGSVGVTGGAFPEIRAKEAVKLADELINALNK